VLRYSDFDINLISDFNNFNIQHLFRMSDESNKTGSSTYHIDKLSETNYRSRAQQLKWIELVGTTMTLVTI
jgi:hypothetical protein